MAQHNIRERPWLAVVLLALGMSYIANVKSPTTLLSSLHNPNNAHSRLAPPRTGQFYLVLYLDIL